MSKDHNIGDLINDLKLLDTDQFQARYRKYHTEKELEMLYDITKNMLVTNTSIKEGIDFQHFEQVMNNCWNFELQEHGESKREAYDCLKDNIEDKILHGWGIEHLPEGRGVVGQYKNTTF